MLFIVLALTAARDLHAQIRCELRRGTGEVFSGDCVGPAGMSRGIDLSPANSAMLLWHGHVRSDPRYAGMPILLQLGPEGGVSFEEWYAVDDVSESRTGLVFSYDSSRPGPPTNQDLAILSTARSYLSDSTRWSRADDGEIPDVRCPVIAVRRSIICALRDASVHAGGEFYWGRKAVVAMRDGIAKASKRTYPHWFTGFKSDSTTTPPTCYRCLIVPSWNLNRV